MKKFLMCTTLLFVAFSISVEAQILDRLAKKTENKIEREAEERTERRVDKGIDNVYDKVEEEIDNVGSDNKAKKGKKSNRKSKKENKTDHKQIQKNIANINDTIVNSSLQSYSKFDFIPGEKVVFFDDFASESLGDFPLNWLTSGSGEIVTTNLWEGRFFQITKTGYYIPEIHEKFTENFTIEFDLLPVNSAMESIYGIDFYILSGDVNAPGYGSQPGQAGFRIHPDYDNIMWNNWSESLEWQGDEGSVTFALKSNEKYRISFWIQKQRVRMYVNEKKALDVPRGLQANYVYNIFRIETFAEESTPYIGNFRISTGLPDMRSKLITEGKLVSYGIYFDVNKDIVKPESYGTLKEIATVLNENPDVKVNIVGHTDSDGSDTSNLDLSKRRGAAVKNILVNDFGIQASRLESDGAGEMQPVAKNDTAASKALNRRVEFIKL